MGNKQRKQSWFLSTEPPTSQHCLVIFGIVLAEHVYKICLEDCQALRDFLSFTCLDKPNILMLSDAFYQILNTNCLTVKQNNCVLLYKHLCTFKQINIVNHYLQTITLQIKWQKRAGLKWYCLTVHMSLYVQLVIVSFHCKSFLNTSEHNMDKLYMFINSYQLNHFKVHFQL